MSFVLLYDECKFQNRVSKNTSLPSIGFWAIAQQKIKILAWNFVKPLVTHSSITYIPFFGISIKFWIVGHLFLKQMKF